LLKKTKPTAKNARKQNAELWAAQIKANSKAPRSTKTLSKSSPGTPSSVN